MSPWIVSDELWDRLEPLLPQRDRRFRYPGRKPLPNREVLCGILYVLHTGIQWEYLPQDLRLRLRHDLLAPFAGLERSQRLAAAARVPACRTQRGFAPGLVPLRGRLPPRQGVKRGSQRDRRRSTGVGPARNTT